MSKSFATTLRRHRQQKRPPTILSRPVVRTHRSWLARLLFNNRRATAVVSPQYPGRRAKPFCSRYAANLFLHRSPCNQVSCSPDIPIERNISRAALTANGPGTRLRLIRVFPNRDGSSPIVRRNSGTTPWAAVSLVNGRAINSAPKRSANSINCAYLKVGDESLP